MTSNGIILEKQLRTYLEGSCGVYFSDTYDKRYKLDFVVMKFHKVVRFPDPFGLQVTTRLDAPHKMEEFGCMVLQYRPTKRAGYLEVEPGTDIEGGGGELVYAALLSLLFSKAHAGDTLVGLRVSNTAFEFFDLRDRLQSFPGPHVDWNAPETVVGELLEGEVRRYNPAEKYGHIVSRRRSKPFHLHRTEIADEVLGEELDALGGVGTRWVKHLRIPVIFSDGGKCPGHNLPAALKVRVHK